MKSIKRFFFTIIILGGILFFTNPDKQDHQEKIVEKYKEENPLTGALGAGEFVKEMVSYHNYHVCSISKISGMDKSVSFGIAGYVMVFSSLDINKYKDMLPK